MGAKRQTREEACTNQNAAGRTSTGTLSRGHGVDVVWLALKYAAHCTRPTQKEVPAIHQRYLDRAGGVEDAEANLRDFLDTATQSPWTRAKTAFVRLWARYNRASGVGLVASAAGTGSRTRRKDRTVCFPRSAVGTLARRTTLTDWRSLHPEGVAATVSSRPLPLDVRRRSFRFNHLVHPCIRAHRRSKRSECDLDLIVDLARGRLPCQRAACPFSRRPSREGWTGTLAAPRRRRAP